MIELHIEVLRKICLQQLQILAAVRVLTEKQGVETQWILDWENSVADAVKQCRQVQNAKGPILRIE